jgi:periplasmic copper chaperone A
MSRPLLLAVLLGLAACRADAPVDSPALAVQDAWARPASGADTMRVHSAAYFLLENNRGEAVRLVEARSDVAERVEIHETSIDDGVMRMRPRDRVDVPAGESVRFEPGGLHVMLVQLRRDLVPGDSLTITLVFEDGTTHPVPVAVRQPDR